MRFHGLVGAICLFVITLAASQTPEEIVYLHLNRVNPRWSEYDCGQAAFCALPA
jgi:hypothetical protein